MDARDELFIFQERHGSAEKVGIRRATEGTNRDSDVSLWRTLPMVGLCDGT